MSIPVSAKNAVQGLLDFIDASPSPCHVIQHIEALLVAQSQSWQRLDETAKWLLQAGGRYYVVRDDSSIVLFIKGEKPLVETGF